MQPCTALLESQILVDVLICLYPERSTTVYNKFHNLVVSSYFYLKAIYKLSNRILRQVKSKMLTQKVIPFTECKELLLTNLFSEKIFPTIIIALLLKHYNREYYLIVHLIMSAVNSLLIAVLPSKHTWTNTDVCKQYGKH